MLTLKIAKILAAQASAQPLKNNCDVSAITSQMILPQACAAIIAAQVPTSACNAAHILLQQSVFATVDLKLLCLS